jgi:hypothetical protein
MSSNSSQTRTVVPCRWQLGCRPAAECLLHGVQGAFGSDQLTTALGAEASTAALLASKTGGVHLLPRVWAWRAAVLGLEDSLPSADYLPSSGSWSLQVLPWTCAGLVGSDEYRCSKPQGYSWPCQPRLEPIQVMQHMQGCISLGFPSDDAACLLKCF